MDLVNTNRLRVTLMTPANVRVYWPGVRFAAGSYKSGDHGKPRLETNAYLRVFDWMLQLKWRPDGKAE